MLNEGIITKSIPKLFVRLFQDPVEFSLPLHSFAVYKVFSHKFIERFYQNQY